MGDSAVADGEFTLKDAPIENLRPLKVRVVGAGYSGILAAIRLVPAANSLPSGLPWQSRANFVGGICLLLRIPEKLRNIDLVVYEKNEGLGGVW